MKTMQTRRGALALPQTLEELASMDWSTCLDWLRRCDPNGAWSAHELAEYETTLEALQEALWCITEDER